MIPAGLDKRLDALMDAAVASGRINGGHMIAAVDGKVIYRRVAGQFDREAGVPMRDDAVYRLASVSKPVVSAALLALCERGQCRLDDPVTAYLPQFRPALADGTAPVITLLQLATHTSGLTYETAFGTAEPVSTGVDPARPSLAENIRRIGNQPLAYMPGTGWLYSFGIDVLGGVIEVITGGSLQEAVATLVTGPLGLKDLGFFAHDAARLAPAYGEVRTGPASVQAVRMAEPWQFRFDDGTMWLMSPARALDAAAFPSGGAGMCGTADDVLAFLEAMRQGGGPVLASARPFMDDAIAPVTAGETGRGYSIGGAVWTDPAAAGLPCPPGTVLWGGLYGHSWFIDPVNRLAFVCCSNVAALGDGGLYPDTLHAVYGTG